MITADIVAMDVLAGSDGPRRYADRRTEFHYGLLGRDCGDGDLVARRDCFLDDNRGRTDFNAFAGSDRL